MSLLALVAAVIVAIPAAMPVGAAGPDPIVPDCLPGQTSNCVPTSTVPADSPVPDPTVDSPQLDPDSGAMVQTLTVSGAKVGDYCAPSPFTTWPCTRIGVNVSARVYVAGASADVPTSTYGISVSRQPDCIYASIDGVPFDGSCTVTVSWYPNNPSLSTARPVIITISTRVETSATTWSDPAYALVVTVGSGGGAPTASFTAAADPTPGQYVFTATSVDPINRPMTHAWDFGDGTSGTGSPVVHRYTRPGTFTAKLTSTNNASGSASTTKAVTVKAPKLAASINLLGGAAPPLQPGTPVQARVTVSASDDGVGKVAGITFPDGFLTQTPADAFTITGPDPAPPGGGFDLAAGQPRTFDVALRPDTVGHYNLVTAVRGTDDTGAVQNATANSPGEIGESLRITIALDPPTIQQEEGPDGPTPVDVTATVTFTNTTPVAMDSVLLRSLRVDRTKPGDLLAVTQTGGIAPGDDGVEVGPLAAGQSKSVTATFRATDDAEVEFTALATAHLVDGRSELGLGRQRWSVKPKYYLGLTTRVTNPAGSALLPAGELIRVVGTVKNLTDSATVEVGPLYPTLTGNAGVSSMAWDTTGTDPKDLVPAGNITLGPGESRDFTVRILTMYSDPTRMGSDGEQYRSGGTRADVAFTPHGKATLDDGTEVAVDGDHIRATAADLTHRVGIDDSISIPPFEWGPWAGSVLVGGVEGLWNATASIVTGVFDLVKLPYTTLVAAAEIQQQVWDSFSLAEREAFSRNVATMSAAVLMRNAAFAQEGLAALGDRIDAASYAAMTRMANNWHTGDYTSTSRLWASYGADALGQVFVPIALATMAKSRAAAAALLRAQEALQARMAPVLGRVPTLAHVQEIGPVLLELASGTELRPDQLDVLYGITPEELAALQRLATEEQVLMTVRSRHASSIEWIERYNALLKPETLKIKTVSELDAKLGYNAHDIGSLVFKKPEALKTFEAGGDLRTAVDEFVRSKGFEPGTGDYLNAMTRVIDRSSEWRKWEKYYKRWSDQGWIDVSLNYEGNAIGDTVRKGRSGLGVAPLESGKYKGFRLRKTAEDDYVVEMFNDKIGDFVPVTGDIDPIAFTHLDGSPLTEAEHARLLDRMARDPLLQTQHGESATFVEGGVNFILKQFKPNEPGLQIAPGTLAPRVVRINREKSRWVNPFDYHLHFDGGFVYSGSYIPKTAIPLPAAVVASTVEPEAQRIRAIPKATGPEPNVGRCRINYGTSPTDYQAIVDTTGKLRRLSGDGKPTDDTSLSDDCFSPGPPVEKVLKPVTGLLNDETVGATELEIPDDASFAHQGDGVRIGDTVAVGAGTDGAELHTVTAFGSIIIEGGLERAHEAGELIVVVSRSDTTDPPPSPTTSTPATSTPTPTSAPPARSTSTSSVAPGVTLIPPASLVRPSVGGEAVSRPADDPARASGAALAVTGTDSGDTAGAGLLMIALGLLMAASVRRRKRSLSTKG